MRTDFVSFSQDKGGMDFLYLGSFNKKIQKICVHQKNVLSLHAFSALWFSSLAINNEKVPNINLKSLNIMLNHYETAFVLTPVLSEPQMKEAVEKFENLLTQNGGTILNREEWGLRKLAYPIQGKTTGFYALLQFDVEPEVIATLETAFRRDERVIRFLTTRLDKYAFEYAEKRRNVNLKKEEA